MNEQGFKSTGTKIHYTGTIFSLYLQYVDKFIRSSSSFFDYLNYLYICIIMLKSFYILIIISLAVLNPDIAFAQSREVPFTLEDRDRIIQIGEKLNSQQQQINDMKHQISDVKESFQQQINDLKESTQQQINDLRSLFYWGFGIVISLILFLFGFIIWDRRTVTEPIREKTQILLQVLREYSKDQPKLSEILRSHGI